MIHVKLASWPLELAAAAAAGSHRTDGQGSGGANARKQTIPGSETLMAERMNSDGILQVGRTWLGLDRGGGGGVEEGYVRRKCKEDEMCIGFPLGG
jgi:hypothetical protein